ncbi:hypothetical protein [Lactobacillus brevis] [Lactiplantibacillus mudanjiangensis]|uniref:phage neck terminator protein n=1 Tax=Lactiplantibacillus mudanjiangensis TaxID=1296538 RepID=UPI001014007D|nr:hypothetical protein [Lactiplantibacillus mudanjiangensis]VDG32881.1 hypothetical protein [Lactobacillus brevis] [Lactiplantibacillus mudanjiangensis]
MYETVILAILNQIRKYKDIQIVQEKMAASQTKRPFFSYAIYDDAQELTSLPYDHAPFLMGVQFKAHADDDFEAKDLAKWVRDIIQSKQPSYELALQGISVVKANAMPPLNEDWTTEIEYMAGADFQLLVNSDYVDQTQPGQITGVDLDQSTIGGN